MSRPGDLLLQWAGVLLAPLAFALDLQASYALVYRACAAQSSTLLHLFSAGAVALALLGWLAAWRAWQAAGADWSAEAGGALGRSRFLGAMGLLSSGFFLLVILAAALPRFVLGPCEE